MSGTRWRLSIDFKSLDDVRTFAAAMADRSELPANAVIRIQDSTDLSVVTPAHRLIWGRRDEAFDGTLVWPDLDPEVERRVLRERMRELETS